MAATADLPPVTTVKETAEYLRVCDRTVYNLIRDGQLATLPHLRHKRITRKSIEAYLDGTTGVAR